jgi:hypothetical protein
MTLLDPTLASIVASGSNDFAFMFVHFIACSCIYLYDVDDVTRYLASGFCFSHLYTGDGVLVI